MFSLKILKILWIFFIFLFKKSNGLECGCSQVEGQHLQWNYFYAPFYHYFISKQIVGYYKYWANEILEHEISYDGSVVLKNLELIQVQDMKCNSKEVSYHQSAPTYDDNIATSSNQTEDMLRIIDNLINKEKVKGLRDFKGIFQQFDQIKTHDYSDETQLDFNWISQKFLDFRQLYKCPLGFSECVKKVEQKIKTFHFIIKINLNFEGDGEEKKRSFFIVNRLIPLHTKGNLTYKFQPFFYQHTCEDSGLENITYSPPEMNIFNGASGHKTTSQMIDQIQLLYDEQPYPNALQINSYVNQPILLNYFGHHDRPGVSEFRTSCVHALASLRRAIELYIKLQFDPNYIINYCPDPIVTYFRPNKKKFQSKVWEWLIDMYGVLKLPNKNKEKPVEKKEKPVEQKEQPVEQKEKKIETPVEEPIQKKAPEQKIELPAVEELMPKFKPFYYESKIQNIHVKETKIFQIQFLCEEFIYAIKQKLLQEDYQDLLFDTGFINFNCDFLPPRQFNPSNIWATNDISQEEFTSRGIITYFQEEIGYFEFTRKPKSGDYAIYNLCFESEIKFFTFYLTKQNCIEERIFNSHSLIEGKEAHTLFSYHYGRTIFELRRMIDEIQLIFLGKLRYRDIIQIGKESFNIPQEDGVSTGDFIFSYGVCKQEQPYFEYYQDTSSFEGYRGLSFYGYYQNLPHVPLQMTIQQSSEFNFFIEINTGLQTAKFYYPSLIRLNRKQVEDMKEHIEETQATLKTKLEKDQVDQIKQAEILNRSKIDTRKKFIAKLFKNEYLAELQSFITDTIYKKNGLTQFLASTAILKQQGKQNVVGEVNDAIQNGDLGKYMNTNIMNITLYSALTNAIFMSLNYKRLDIDQDMFKLVTQKLPLEQIKESDLENLSNTEIQETINKHYEEKCKPLSEVQFSNQYHSDYNLSQFGDWVFKEKDKHLNKKVKEFITDVEANYEETISIYSVEQIANIITYDLNLGQFLYNSYKNNFFSFIYGIEEYSAKLVVNLFQFSYNISNTYYIYFKTYYFSSQYLLTFGNQFEFIINLMSIINEVDNHFRLVAHKAMTTAFNCDRLSKDDIELIIDQVLEDLSQKELVPDSICKVKDGLINNEFLEIKLNGDKLHEMGTYDKNKKCENEPGVLQVMKFIELEDSYKIVVNELKGQQHMKFQVEQTRPARQQHSTYEFLQKNGYDYKPVLYRQIHSYFYHLFVVSCNKKRKTNPDVDCGCGDVPGEHLNWDYFFVPFYHNFIIKQIVEYYQFWAKYIVGHNISFFNDIKLQDIKITQVSQANCNYTEIDYTQLPAGSDPQASMASINDMISKIEDLKKSVRGISQFQGYFKEFKNLHQDALDIGLDLGWITQEINDFMEQFRCDGGLSACTKQNEKNIPDKFFTLKVNLSFTFDNEEQQRSYFIVNKLIREYRQGNLTFKFYPYFIQHSCEESGIKGIEPQSFSYNKKPFANDKSFNTSLIDTAIKEMQSIQKDDYDKETDSFVPQPYPSKKQQLLFVNKVFPLKYFGHHDRPGVSEYRTSCRHALAALRRSIEIYIRLWFEPGYTINYCPKLIKNYSRPPKKQFKNYPWWLILMWQGKPPQNFDDPIVPPRDPPVNKEQKEGGQPDIPDDPLPKRQKIDLPPQQQQPDEEPEIEPPTLKYTPFEFTFKYESPKPIDIIMYQLNFICLEFTHAVKSKWFAEEKFQNMLFNTGFFSFNCQDSSFEFDPENPWIQGSLPDLEFQTKGFIYFNKNVRIGEFIFFRKQKKGDYETYNICFELDIAFQNTFITKQNCSEEIVHSSNQVNFTDPIPVIFQQYFGPILVDMADAISQLNIELEGFLFQDTMENVLINKLLTQSEEYKFSAYTYQCTTDEGRTFQQAQEYQMRARQGFIITGYVNKFPDIPIKVELVNHQQMYYEIYISTGLELTKFYLQTSYSFSKKKYQEFVEDVQKAMEAKEKELESQSSNDQEKQSKLAEFERQYKQDKLVELFDLSHFDEIKQYLKNQYENLKDGQQTNNFSYLKSTIENSQSLDQSFFQAESEKMNKSKLAQYYNTNMLSLSVFATTFNFVFMLFNYKRLGVPKEQLADIVQNREVLLQQPEKIDQQQEDSNQQCAKYEQAVQEEQQNLSVTLSELNHWVFQESADQNFGDISELMAEFQLVPEVVNESLITTVDQLQDLIAYDLTMISQGYRQNSLNKVEFMYGNSNFGQKIKVNIFQYQYRLFNIYVVEFKNFFFSNSFIFNFSSQSEFLIHLGQVIVDVNNHFSLIVKTVQKTLYNCDELTVKMVEDVIDKVLSDFAQIPGSFCKGEITENSQTVLSYRYDFNQESEQKWAPGSNNCSGNQKQLQEVFLVREYKDKFQFVFDGVRSVNKRKQINGDQKTGKHFNQTYTFLKKNGYDYQPVLFRQLHSVFSHLFNGTFSNKIPEDNKDNQIKKNIILIQ